MRRAEPGLDGLIALAGAEGPGAGDVLAARPQLVGPRSGIVCSLSTVHKDQAEPPLPRVISARLANHRFLGAEHDDDRSASGKGMTTDEAVTSALGEAVERYSSSAWTAERIVRGRRADLRPETVNPHRLVLYAEDQYTDLRYAPYHDDKVISWVAGRSLVRDRTVLLPALGVLMHYAVPPEEHLFQGTSNGLATGPTLLETVLAAALEVIERDAFMTTWLARLPAQRLALDDTHSRDARRIAEAYRRRGTELRLYRLATDSPAAVVLGLAVDETGDPQVPAVVAGLGCAFDVQRAARKAALEVAQVRPALRRRLREPGVRRRLAELLEDPSRVATLDDHDLLYASPALRDVFAFLDAPGVKPHPVNTIEGKRHTVEEALTALVEHAGASGNDLLYVSLTPPDMEALGLWTARVVLLDYQPIAFGAREQRLGGTRPFLLPSALRLRPRPLTRAELNPFPHPLA